MGVLREKQSHVYSLRSGCVVAAVQKIGQNCAFIFGKAVQAVQLHADGVVLTGAKSGDTSSVGVGIGPAGVDGDNVVLSVIGLLAGIGDIVGL